MTRLKHVTTYWRWLWVLFAVGLVVRIVFVLCTYKFVPTVDNFGYVYRALYLWNSDGHLMPLTYQGRIYPDAYWPPGYPIFLVLLLAFHQVLQFFGILGAVSLYAAKGGNHVEISMELVHYLRLASTVIGTLNVLLVATIARRLFGDLVGLIAAGLTAIYIPLIVVGASLYSESLYVPLMLGAVVCVLNFRAGRSRWWLAGAGALVGVGTLVHADGVIVIVTLMLGAFGWPLRPLGPRRALLRRLAAPATILAVMALVIAPWTIRNEVKFHAFIPLGTSFGTTIAGTYNPHSAHSKTRPFGWVVPHTAYPRIWRRHQAPGLHRVSVFEQAALNYIGKHPQYLLGVMYWNTRRLFELNGVNLPDGTAFSGWMEGADRFWDWVGDIMFWCIGVLAIVALCTKRFWRSEQRWLWWAPLLFYLSVVLVSSETPRFRAEIDPFVLMLAAFASGLIVERIGHGRVGRSEVDLHTVRAAGDTVVR